MTKSLLTQAYRYYELLELLTRQRDIDALNRALIDVMMRVLGVSELRVYVASQESGKYKAVSAAANLLVGEVLEIDASDAELMRLLDRHPAGQGQEYLEEGGQLVLPIRADQSLLGVILAQGTLDPKIWPLIRVVTGIYVNQYSLISYCMRDALTGLYNRQAFDQLMKKIIHNDLPAARREDEAKKGMWYLALLDIDHFKRVNDKFGHVYGDEVLLLFSRIMLESFRGDDLLFRYGGEEFAIALRNVDVESAKIALERYRKNIEAYLFPQVGRVTVSIGYTSVKSTLLVSTITDAADKALYYSKEHGRNQLNCYDELLEQGAITTQEYSSDDVELF